MVHMLIYFIYLGGSHTTGRMYILANVEKSSWLPKSYWPGEDWYLWCNKLVHINSCCRRRQAFCASWSSKIKLYCYSPTKHNSGWCNVIFVVEMTPPPTTINFSPTSTQPRETKLGIQEIFINILSQPIHTQSNILV